MVYIDGMRASVLNVTCYPFFNLRFSREGSPRRALPVQCQANRLHENDRSVGVSRRAPPGSQEFLALFLRTILRELGHETSKTWGLGKTGNLRKAGTVNESKKNGL